MQAEEAERQPASPRGRPQRARAWCTQEVRGGWCGSKGLGGRGQPRQGTLGAGLSSLQLPEAQGEVTTCILSFKTILVVGSGMNCCAFPSPGFLTCQ